MRCFILPALFDRDRDRPRRGEGHPRSRPGGHGGTEPVLTLPTRSPDPRAEPTGCSPTPSPRVAWPASGSDARGVGASAARGRSEEELRVPGFRRRRLGRRAEAADHPRCVSRPRRGQCTPCSPRNPRCAVVLLFRTTADVLRARLRGNPGRTRRSLPDCTTCGGGPRHGRGHEPRRKLFRPTSGIISMLAAG